MHSFNRRTATKVKDGRVQRKNRRQLTSHSGYVLDRQAPGKGYRHVVSKRDLQQLIDLIPNWDHLSERLERIVLEQPSQSDDGAYEFFHREETGAIMLHAWPEDLWMEIGKSYFEAHQSIFERLEVSYDASDECYFCRFTEPQAQAFVLLHIFLHELGHHCHRMRNKHRGTKLDEQFAERFAHSRFEQLWPEYIRVFGDPRKARD